MLIKHLPADIKDRSVGVSVPQSNPTSVRRNGARVWVRELTTEDHQQVTHLTRRHGIQTEPLVQWTHLWFSNPAYGKTRNWPLGWVLEDTQGRVVGHLGNIPLEYIWRGSSRLAATSRTWVVDEPFRGFAPLLLDCHFTQRNVDLFVHPTVNVQASAAYATFQARRVPVGQWDRAAFAITGYQGLTEAWLRMRRVPFSKALSYGGAAALFLKDRVIAGPQYRDIQFEECHTFDHRFDDFWRELQARNKTLLLAVRSRETLQWHFKYAFTHKRISVIAAIREGRIYAYAIFLRYDNYRLGLRRTRLVDFQALDDRDAVLTASLSWIREKCRRDAIHTFEIVGIVPACHHIERLVPHTRQLPAWLYYYYVPDPNLAKELADPLVWSPCTYDGDASL
jgi:hypothetical protein